MKRGFEEVARLLVALMCGFVIGRWLGEREWRPITDRCIASYERDTKRLFELLDQAIKQRTDGGITTIRPGSSTQITLDTLEPLEIQSPLLSQRLLAGGTPEWI